MATIASGADAGGDAPGSRPLADDERAELVALRRRYAGRRWWRSALSALLITLAAVLTPLSAVAVWVADEMSDTDRYVATVAPLARHPDVQAAVSGRVTDAIMKKVDLDALLSSVKPSQRPALESALGTLSGPITSGVRDVVQAVVAKFVASAAFERLWVQLNRQAHTAFTGALTGDSDTAVKVNGDEVVIDLAPVVDQVKQRLVDQGLGVAAHIPRVHTDFVLVKSHDVRRVRTGFRALQLAGNWLPVVTVVLAAAGVLLAARRRRALVTAALAIAAGIVVLGIGLSLFRIIYLDHLPAKTDERAAGEVYDQLVRFLWATIRMVVALGVVVALGAWLSGRGRWALRVRRAWESAIAGVREAAGIRSTGAVGAWVHRHRTLLQWCVAAAAAVVLVVWSYPTGLVIILIAVVTLAVLAVVEFVDDGRRPPGPPGPPGPHEPASPPAKG
ncbi:hypothetical protein V2S66_29480 [Streptomyces sp. V4-01]|uniref:Integral membrane protein n=1 Tax=Actinacidiphila polyblastidii TaxID=3110430 RepID=A0ABU7PJX9_9ACTN|nr:hypothetical protein [Streptomyces sp. V4-01]